MLTHPAAWIDNFFREYAGKKPHEIPEDVRLGYLVYVKITSYTGQPGEIGKAYKKAFEQITEKFLRLGPVLGMQRIRSVNTQLVPLTFVDESGDIHIKDGVELKTIVGMFIADN